MVSFLLFGVVFFYFGFGSEKHFVFGLYLSLLLVWDFKRVGFWQQC